MDASSPSQTAAVLLDRATCGSQSSLGRLMDLYSEYLKFVVSSQMDDRLRTRVSASDIVQESFYEAHRDFHAFRGNVPEEFLAWLRRILVNNLMRVVEKNVVAAKRDVRREVSLDRIRRGVEQSSWRYSPLLSSDAETPSTVMRQKEAESELAVVLATLPADYRRVIRLRNIEGLPFGEVAQRMGRSSGAVRMLWLRALERLRAAYAEPDDE